MPSTVDIHVALRELKMLPKVFFDESVCLASPFFPRASS